MRSAAFCLWALAAIGLAAPIMLPGSANAAPTTAEPVRIGVAAFRPKSLTREQWQPLIKALKRTVADRDFNIDTYSFSELEAAAASRQVDFVLTNPGHYILINQQSGLSAPLATLVSDAGGQSLSVFGGVIFSQAGRRDIETVKDLKHKIVATAEVNSLGGYQMQAYEMARAGIRLPQDVRILVTELPHDNAVKAVLSGRADVGLVRSGVLEAMAREDVLDLAKLKILNQQDLPNFPQRLSTRLYPEWSFAALPHIDPRLARKVTAALFLLEEQDPGAMRAMGIHGFTIPADHTPVEDLLRELRLPPFDRAPHFTAHDVWERYRWMIVSILLAGGVIVLLLIRLLANRRRLSAEHHLVLQHAEALQRSNADLEQFAYSVSHDMRQPLRSVTGHLQLLEKGLSDQLDADNRENLAFALDGAKRMDAMIVSLLDYSRVGRKTEAKQWLASRQPLDEALGFLAQSIEEAHASVDIGGDWPRIFASRDELTRLFQNLIGNALKYHEPDQPPRIEVTASVSAECWRVMVRDHGIGIDPRQSDRLFQFFSRLQSRTRFEGAGMGLALCRRIVEHHAGRIWVESEGPGQGSTFIFELPLNEDRDKESKG